MIVVKIVSTYSRAEAAAWINPFIFRDDRSVSTHSRAEAAAEVYQNLSEDNTVSTRGRAEAAAPYLKKQEKSAY